MKPTEKMTIKTLELVLKKLTSIEKSIADLKKPAVKPKTK